MKFNGKTLSVVAQFEGGEDNFWDVFLEWGKRENYYYGFSGYWTNDSFKPTYKIRPTIASYMFAFTRITDLTNADIDFGGITSNNQCTRPFEQAAVEKIGNVDLSNVTGALNTFFASSAAGTSNIKTIQLLKIPDNGVHIFGTNFFQNCNKLENITIDGLIVQSLDMAHCPLSPASMKSILTHLKDYRGDEQNAGAWTIKFSAACWSELDADGTTSPTGGAWSSYPDEIGWLCE